MSNKTRKRIVAGSSWRHTLGVVAMLAMLAVMRPASGFGTVRRQPRQHV